jgi:hypothetical protein
LRQKLRVRRLVVDDQHARAAVPAVHRTQHAGIDGHGAVGLILAHCSSPVIRRR